MSFCGLLLSSVTLFSLSAFAGGFDYSSMISDGVYRGDRNCNHNSQIDDLRACIQNVNIIGSEDGRYNLSEVPAELGIKNFEQRIGETTAAVICKLPYTKNIVSTASIVGDGSFILTAAHAFCYKPETGGPAVNLRKESDPPCYIETQGAVRNQAVFDYTDKHTIFGTTGKNDDCEIPSEDPNDFAVVKLNKVIDGAKPFPMLGRPMKVGDQFVAVA